MEQYIPDLTERFPEGFGGVDLTSNYFPDDYYSYQSYNDYDNNYYDDAKTYEKDNNINITDCD